MSSNWGNPGPGKSSRDSGGLVLVLWPLIGAVLLAGDGWVWWLGVAMLTPIAVAILVPLVRWARAWPARRRYEAACREAEQQRLARRQLLPASQWEAKLCPRCESWNDETLTYCTVCEHWPADRVAAYEATLR